MTATYWKKWLVTGKLHYYVNSQATVMLLKIVLVVLLLLLSYWIQQNPFAIWCVCWHLLGQSELAVSRSFI